MQQPTLQSVLLAETRMNDETKIAQPVACDPAYLSAAALPHGAAGVPRRGTAMPRVIHTQKLGEVPNPFFGPYTGQLAEETFPCFICTAEARQVGSVQLFRVYDEAQTTPRGWGRVLGDTVQVYATIEGD